MTGVYAAFPSKTDWFGLSICFARGIIALAYALFQRRPCALGMGALLNLGPSVP